MVIVISVRLFSQNTEVPKDYKFQKAEDFAPYDQDVLKCVDFLMKTSISECPEKRDEASNSVLAWMTASPYVKIYLNPEIVTFLVSSPDLLIFFMGGWVKTHWNRATSLVAQKLESSPCLGVFYWEPQAYNNWKAYTLGAFDAKGRSTEALDAFGEVVNCMN